MRPTDSFMAEGGDDSDTVEYGENTVFASDLCDVSGEGCGPGGEPPPDAQKIIGKEDRSRAAQSRRKVSTGACWSISAASVLWMD